MKKTIICNIPMRSGVSSLKYASSNPKLIPVSDQLYVYPINSFLSKTVRHDDELQVIFIIKADSEVALNVAEQNVNVFKNEMDEIIKNTGAKIEYAPFVQAKFSEGQVIHKELIMDLVENIAVDSHIFIDITYGGKDITLIEFAVLDFVEKFLNCEVESLFYGQKEFSKNDNQIPENGKILDFISMYLLRSVVQIIPECDDPIKAKKLLRSILI